MEKETELKEVFVFAYDSKDETPIILGYGKYTVGDAVQEFLEPLDKRTYYIKNGNYYEADDEILMTKAEAAQQYGEIPVSVTTAHGKHAHYELIPASRLADVGNGKFLQAAKECAKKFPMYKSIAEVVNILYKD